ncbi:MAG: tripartite tricarboxylate transporter substrate binding protein [Betaproteobacteria bacterium]|nr:tripartite tricarboxylate transporter substrate binding protein [Betaproteobacteria bacterium]
MTPARNAHPRHDVDGPVSSARRRWLAGACTLAVGAWVPGRATESRFPSKSVRIVAPQAPGGPSDTVARLVAQHFSDRWKQSVVVENHGGAGGTIGARVVARAPADGHTLLVGSNAVIMSAAAHSPVAGHDPLRDWAPIGRIVRVGYVLAVRPGLGVATLRELVALARGRATALTVATVGAGSNSSMALALFAREAGIPLLEVPYKGGAPGLQGVVGEHVDATFCDLSLALPMAATGAVRIPATCGRRRLALAPDIPTFAEEGFPGVVAEPWYGIVAPAGTPSSIIAEVATALRAMQNDPEVGRRFATLGYETILETPAGFVDAIRDEVAQARSVAQGAAPRP